MKSLITILFFTLLFSSEMPDESILDLKAPDSFKVKFTTTVGDFVVQAQREWSPQGVDRLYQLVSSGFYDSIAVFRVVDGFVAQFGIHDEPPITKFWNANPIDDETTQVSNKRGTISFARAGDKTRSCQLFINLEDNARLDDFPSPPNKVIGYPPIAEVIEGMDEVVDEFYDGYGERPTGRQAEMEEQGNAFLRKKFRKLDYILSAEIIKWGK